MRRLLPVRKCRSSEKWAPLLCSSGWVLLNHCICSTFWLSLCYGSSSIFHWRWREMGMTALEDRISGLLTAFLSMDLPSMPSSAVLVAGQNIVFNFFFFFFTSIPFVQNFIKAPLYCEAKFDIECVPAQQEKIFSSIWDGSIRHWKYLLVCSRKSFPLTCFKGWACYCSLFRRGN